MLSTSRLSHLVRRFAGSFRGRELTLEQRDAVRRQLSPPEYTLFERMSSSDQAHAVEVADAVAASNDPRAPADPSWLATAALLHDIGKVDSRAGTFERVAATLVEPVAPPALVRRMATWPSALGRIGRHVSYPEVGASMLTLVGSHEHVRSWAAQHHRSEREWTIPADLGRRLRDADDGAS